MAEFDLPGVECRGDPLLIEAGILTTSHRILTNQASVQCGLVMVWCK